MTRRVLDQLLQMRETDPYLRGMVRWVGFRQMPVEYERLARGGGVTHFPILGSLNPYKAVIKAVTAHSNAPIFVVLLGGLAVATLSLLGLAADGLLMLGGLGSVTAAWVLLG